MAVIMSGNTPFMIVVRDIKRIVPAPFASVFHFILQTKAALIWRHYLFRNVSKAMCSNSSLENEKISDMVSCLACTIRSTKRNPT